ncbi:sensor histidine kinase [Sphingomonas sp. CJ20]
MQMTATLAEHDPAVTILPAAPDPSAADEINHRIANSLQLLSALVSVEARGLADPAARAALDMTRRRIGAIASVHRQLYQTEGGDRVNLATYLEELAGDLEDGYADRAGGRRICVDAAPIHVAPEQATAIGILVSELVTNACKYAYAPGTPGDIALRLCAIGPAGYRLEVEDRGCGLHGGTPQGTGLGSRLIDLMVARLRGFQAWQDARPGTRFVLSVLR